jgi:GT2 family glycosyltransferase
MRPVGTTSFGRAVAAVTSSPIGMGPGKFHYADEPQEVDTVYLGAFRREVVQAVGGYDEVELQWAAEDQELNFRIRQAGGSIQLDPSITSWYFPRETPRALWRQYANYGVCKASTLKKHRTLPTWRPLAPAGMVAATAAWVVLCVLGRRPRWAPLPLIAYGAAAGAAALRFGRDPGVAPHRAFAVLAICHWGYGLGFWRGVWWILRGKPFQNRPSGHR